MTALYSALNCIIIIINCQIKEVERTGVRTKANERLLYCSLFSFVKGLFRLN